MKEILGQLKWLCSCHLWLLRDCWCKISDYSWIIDIIDLNITIKIDYLINNLQSYHLMTIKIVLLLTLVALCLARSYPMYKQCDSKWGSEQLGTSSNTICKAGCLMSSVAMALAGTGHNYNPSTLNSWLKGHGGYVSGDSFVWASVNSIGLKYIGKVANSNIASSLSAGHVVVLNVHNGGHWVLAHSMSGSTIQVNDPGYSTTSYSLSEIVAGNSGLYHVSNGFYGVSIDDL